MSSIPADAHSHVAHAEHAHHGSFLTTYVFSRDHKIIGMQFLFSTLLWFLVGGLLALGVRWQLAYPWSDMPILGQLLCSAEGRPDRARNLHDAVHDARHGDDLPGDHSDSGRGVRQLS